MKLTITEAENILSKVFAGEIAPGKIEIEAGNSGDAGIRHTNKDFYISRDTLTRVVKVMCQQGLKIDAIKFYREIVPGTGLAEAKTAVETIAR